MATLPAPMASEVKKPSFAKIVASTPVRQPLTSRTQGSQPTKDRRDTIKIATPSILPTAAAAVNGSLPTANTYEAKNMNPSNAQIQRTKESQVVEGLKDLKLETKMPSLVVNGTGSTTTERSGKTGHSQTPSDDASQRADSMSELGTKPPSLDGKSNTSGTTFAMDEKESLRPDDSASMKAAAEDDDAFSIRGSLLAGNSRMGSEVAVRLHRIQLGDMPIRTIPHIVSNPHVSTPPTGVVEKPAAAEPKLPLEAATAVPSAYDVNVLHGYGQHPDEKLLEAMKIPKDRLFLLRLEKDLIDFVQGSTEPFVDLPPSNSFCRMLTHKLADYYHMTHSYEAGMNTVRIYRTPFCRVPPSLASIAISAPSSTSSPAPVILPRKIMRRGEDGEPGTASASPSKATSEAGSDSKDKAAPLKEKLTREEREEAYNKARERIFGSSEKADGSPGEIEDGTDMSRASSVSAKERPGSGKRKTGKQRRDDSESFDSRSNYVAWIGPQQPWGSPQYIPIAGGQFGSQYSSPYAAMMTPPQQPYPTSTQSYPPQMVPGNSFAPQYNQMPPYASQPAAPQQQPSQRYQTPLGPGGPALPYAPPMANMSPQAWQQPAYAQGGSPNSFANRAVPPNPYAQYPYGELPAHLNPHDPKSQHPIPGSYRGHPFNPKTRSFVPSSSMPPMQTQPGPYSSGPGSLQGSPQFHQSHMNYNGYQHQPSMQPPVVQPSAYPSNNGPHSYTMVRQASSSSMPPYATPPQVSQQMGQPPHMVHHVPAPHHIPANPNLNIPTKPTAHHGPSPAFSHLPTYGNPATLPRKPSA